MVPKVGIEPTLSRENQILSLARLPVPPLRRGVAKYSNGTWPLTTICPSTVAKT